MRNILILFLIVFHFSFFLSSCSEDDEEVAETIKFNGFPQLDGEYVVFTKVSVNGVDKTLLDEGCPTRLVFGLQDDSLSVCIPEMKIGNMPFAISFKINCNFVRLNSWEIDEHSGGNWEWLKLEGHYGYVSTGDGLKPNGSSIKIFFQPDLNIIEFSIDYNVMNVRTECERQELDVYRTRDYDKEMEKYMEKLADVKKESGLDVLPPSYDRDIPSDSKEENSIVSAEGIKGILSGDIVLNADVKLGGQYVTQSFPTTINFEWNNDVMTIKIDDLQIGRMPFAISFLCNCSVVELNDEDLSVYSPSWYKLAGVNGIVSSNPDVVSGNQGEAICYFNPRTMEMVLNVDFKTSGAIAEFPRQQIKFK